MNKRTMAILAIFIVVIVCAILITVIIKDNKANTNISNNDATNHTNYTNIENENIQTNQVQEIKTNFIQNEQILIVNEINPNINDKEESPRVENIKLKVNKNILNVKLEDNSSVDALIEKLREGDITIDAHEYGNFEKVGSLGFRLPTNDTQIKTTVGDVMLYQGNQITLFYGSNSWSYTRLGKITGVSESELKNTLGSGDTTLVLSID